MTEPGPEHPGWCFSCCRVEGFDESTYIVCSECCHSFDTEADLLEADAEMRGHRLDSGTEVFSCPRCCHDF